MQLPDSAEVWPGADIFAEVVQYSDGDAYDRTGSIFVVPTDLKQSFIDDAARSEIGARLWQPTA